MCELERQQRLDATSLGVFRPAEVEDFIVEPDADEWEPDKQAIINQPSLLLPTKTGLEKVPYKFRYIYRCSDAACPGHKQVIIDWELAALYRRVRDLGDEDSIREALRNKWLGELCDASRATSFYVGNMHQHPQNFMVLGVFWPPKTR
jgi:hypothetical protein